jgi:hypothetical protein
MKQLSGARAGKFSFRRKKGIGVLMFQRDARGNQAIGGERIK